MDDLAIVDNAICIAVTETWLNSDILDQEINISGYDLFRCDRADRTHGGVALYVWDQYTSTIVNKFSNGVCEYLLVRVHQLNHYIAVVYRPPDTSLAEFRQLLSVMDGDLSSLPAPTPDISFLGDLNFSSKDVQWRTNDDGDLFATIHPHRDSSDTGGAKVRVQAAALLELVHQHGMMQVIGQPTRKNKNVGIMFPNNS